LLHICKQTNISHASSLLETLHDRISLMLAKTRYQKH